MAVVELKRFSLVINFLSPTRRNLVPTCVPMC